MKKFLLFFLLVITITQLVFAGDCGSPYFKSVACTTLNHKFTETGFVWNTGTGWLTNTKQDWNRDEILDLNYKWVTRKYDNTIPDDSNSISTNGRIGLGLVGSGDAYGVFAPSVIKDEDEVNPAYRYKMWYSGLGTSASATTGHRIFMAVSPDGLTWTKVDNSIPDPSDTISTNGRIPLGTAGRGDYDIAEGARVIKDGNIFRMYYGGGLNSSTFYGIYQAISIDGGFTWTKIDNSVPAKSNTTSTNGRVPPGTNSSYGDYSRTNYPFVIKENNQYYMFYSGFSAATARIFFATSPDGNNWTKTETTTSSYNPNCVNSTFFCNDMLPIFATTQQDQGHAAASASIVKDQNTYYMLYTDLSNPSIIKLAISYNLVGWSTVYDGTVSASNSTSLFGQIPNGTTGKGDLSRVAGPSIIFDENKFRIWYGGYNGEWRIYYAEVLIPQDQDPDLIQHYDFDNNSGNLVEDNVFGVSGTTYTTNSLSKGLFNSTSFIRSDPEALEYFYTRSTGLWYPADKNFSVSLWAKINFLRIQTNNRANLFSFPNAYNTPYLSLFAVDGYSGGKCFPTVEWKGAGVAGSTISITATSKRVCDGLWHNYVLTRQGNELRLYVDGNFEGSTTITGTIPPMYSNRAYFGSNIFGGVDEIKLYHKSLTLEEIQNDYNKVLQTKFVSSPESVIDGTAIRKWISFKINEDLNFSHGHPLCGANDQNCLPEKFSDGLVSLYHLDVNAKSADVLTNVDSSGNDNNMFCEHPTFPVEGKWSGTKAQFVDRFAGTNFRFDATHIFSEKRFALSFWYKPVSISGMDSLMFWNNGYAGSMRTTGTIIQYYYTSPSSTTTTLSLLGVRSLSLNQWNHIVYTWDGSYYTSYINNQVDINVASSNPPRATPAPTIGSNATTRDNACNFDGAIDDFLIWSNRGITSSEVNYIYTLPTEYDGAFDENIFGIYRFDEDFSATTIPDVSGNNNHARIYASNSAYNGGCIDRTSRPELTTGILDTNAWQMSRDNPATLIYGYLKGVNPTQGTIMYWEKWPEVSSWIGATDGYIFSLKSQSNSLTARLNTLVNSGNIDKYTLASLNNNYWTDSFVGGSRPMSYPNTWNQHVLVYNGSSFKYYFNGKLGAARTFTAFNSLPERFVFGVGTTANYEGKIDELVIWNKELSAIEINELFEKYTRYLDVNIYACEDINCNTKLDSHYFTKVKNNEDILIPDDFTYSKYLGYDVYFKSTLDNSSIPVALEGIELKSIEVTQLPANTAPRGKIISLDGKNINSTQETFSNIQDGNLLLIFDVNDLQNDNIYFTLKYSTNSIDGTGTAIIQDLNLRNTSYCAASDWNESSVECTIDFNSYLIPDGNYYLKLEFYDGISGDYNTWYNTSINKIIIDNTPPVLSWVAPTTWKRGKTTITLTCTDAVICQTTQYKINSGALTNYTAPFVISGDGNYRIDVNAIDSKGNQSDTNTFYVTIGYDGQLFTYNDSNMPESFFAPGEKARLIFYSSLVYSPTITLILSNGTIVQDTMQNISNDPLFGTPDYNTYYYDYIAPSTLGWIDINIQNQVLKKKIYISPVWQDSFTDTNGNIFHFGFDLNINENVSIDRWFWPIDKQINFEYPLKPNSLRILDFNGTNYKEIPSQAYGYQGSGLITSASIAFLSTIGKDQNKVYVIRYSVLDRNINYTSDLISTNDSNRIEISTSDYNVLVDANRGGLVTEIQSNIGTSTDLNGSTYGLFGPVVQDFFGSTYSMNQITSPVISLITGPIVTILTITGSQSIFDFVQRYTFYSNNDFFIVDTNVASRGNLSIQQYNDSRIFLDTSQFSYQVSNEDGNYQTNSLVSLPSQPQSDTNIVGLYNQDTLDSFVAFFYRDQGSLSLSNSTNIAQSPSTTRIDGQSYSGQINSGDTFSSSTAYSFTNPTFIINSVSNLFESLINPLNILSSSTQSNDSTPPQIQSVIILGADHNDDSNISCAVTFSDDILVERVVVNFSDTKDTDKNFVTTIRETSGTLLVTLLSDEVNAGTLTCTAYVSDVALNTVSDNNVVTIVDVSGPIVDTLVNSPDTNAGLDPTVPIVIKTILREYTQVDSVSLFYRTKSTIDSNWSSWVPILMTLDSNNTDYNYLYTYTLTPTSGIYEYKITASDNLGYLTESTTKTINIFTDYTWEVTPTDFGTLPPTPLATNLNVGNFTITNTGDASISFRISSNWEDKEKIWYNNGSVESTESTSGITLTLDKNTSINYSVRLITKSNEKRDDLVITLRPTITAEPTSDEITATILSLSSGPFMLLEFPIIPVLVTQEDENVSIVARLTNAGNEDANIIVLDWNYPSGWVLESGNISENISGYLTPSSYIERELVFSIPADANTGTKQITITASCCGLPEKIQTYTKNIVVVTKGGTIIIDNGGQSGGGGGGGGSSSGASGGSGGGGLPFTVPQQKDLFFQTNEFFELVRGQDSSFKIKVTNPLTNSMEDLNLRVSGIISSYLNLKEKNIPKLDSNEEFVTEIEITSPKYFTPGEYQLTFTIEGYFFDNYKRKTSFKEERQINLLIHDTNRENAQQYLNDINYFIQNLTARGFKLSNLNELFTKSQKLFNSHSYDELKEAYLEAQKIYDTAIDSYLKQQKISTLVNSSMRQGVDTPNTNRLLSLASLAFSRGEYALALERLKEAELTYSLETKGEFNPVVWALANLDRIALMTIMLILASYMFFTGIKLWFLKHKLKDLNSENNLLLNLIQDLQKRAFIENKMSMGEYYDALVQFEKRLARVSQDIINYTTKKNNTLSFKSPITRLSQEKKGLLGTIKETQGLYFNKGLVETRIYRTKIDSLTKRLAVVEQNLVSNELQKTLRIHSAGIDKYFWRVYYKIFK